MCIATPSILVCSLLCCLMDDDAPAKPQYNDKSKAGQAQKSPKKGKPEKLD